MVQHMQNTLERMLYHYPKAIAHVCSIIIPTKQTMNMLFYNYFKQMDLCSIIHYFSECFAMVQDVQNALELVVIFEIHM